jgi:hypothetical protein
LPQRSLASPGAHNSPARADALFDRFIDTTAAHIAEESRLFSGDRRHGILKGGR